MSETAPIRILLADDDDVARTLLKELLTTNGYVVVADVTGGREAIEHVTIHLPDIVLLDVHMPDMSGVDAAREISAAHPDIAVVLFTGDQDLQLGPEDVSAAISVLDKMTSPRHLDSNLRAAVANARVKAGARREVAEARQAVEDRKTIERAKGILQKRTGCSEQEAYKILQRTSQDRSQPMVAIARAVLDSEPGLGGSNGKR